ncbi:MULTISPECIES: hypothetical protein [Acetobacter]|uniref:hypothetical protein n=1 Tax=Acetobacter TaxID=434 RepID=UPI00376FFA7F
MSLYYPSKPKSSLFILIPFLFLSACGDEEPSIKEIETVLSQEFQNDTQQGANEQPPNKISVLERKCRKGNVAYICQLKIQQGNFVDNAELRFAKNNGKWIRVPE